MWGGRLIAVMVAGAFLALSFAVRAEEAGVAEEVVTESLPEHEQLLNEARTLLDQNKPQEAQAKAEKARSLAPQDPAVNRQLAEIYLITDDTKARALLKEIIISEDFPGISRWASIEYYNLAAKHGKVQEAVDELEAAAKKKPKNVALQKEVAEGYVRLRDWGRVVEIYEDLSKKNPDDDTISTRLIDYCLLNKDYDTVIKKLAPVVKENPQDVGASDILARAYTGAGKVKEVIALYKERIKEDPNSPGLRGRYAQVLMEFGLLKDSRQEWAKAFELDPSNLFFKQKVGEIYLEEGDSRNAQKEFQELLAAAKEQKQSRYEDIANNHLAAIKAKK